MLQSVKIWVRTCRIKVKEMEITVSKEYLDDLERYIRENIEFISEVIAEYIMDDELVAAIEGKLKGILFFTGRVYNPELDPRNRIEAMEIPF